MTDESEKLAGKAKEKAGKLTGDEELESEGRTQRTAEETKEKAQELKDKGKGALKAIRDEA